MEDVLLVFGAHFCGMMYVGVMKLYSHSLDFVHIFAIHAVDVCVSLQCSEPCGYGIQMREVVCYSPESRTLVPDYFCDIAKKPPIERQCFLKNCGKDTIENLTRGGRTAHKRNLGRAT